jgi:putative nucleotidyltransferase with HDIG domain
VSKTVPRPLSPGGRAYIWSVASLGLVLAGWSVWRLAHTGVSLKLGLFALLTVVSSRVTLKVPSVTARFSPSEMFTFTCVLLYGPEAGALALAMDSLVLAWHHRWRLERNLFNLGSLTLSVWIAGRLFFLVAGIAPLASSGEPSSGLLLPLGVLALTYFLTNSGLIATAIALDTRRSPLAVWREHFLWLGPGYLAGACVAFLLVVVLHQVQFGPLTAILLIAPVLVVFYFMLQSSFGRAEDAKGHVAALNRLYLSTVETLATAIDAKDEVTHGHIRRVQVAAMALAREIGITDAPLLQAIEAAALLHDTGKIAVPEHILNKPGKLTAAEFEKMKLHAPLGAEILSSIEFPYPVVPIVRHHHENWDGTGYPDRIAGASIPIGARILSVVDCYDALTSDRPYRRRMTDEAAVAILLERRGTMYDPMIVDAFVKARHQVMPEAAATHPVLRTLGDARESIAQAVDAAAPALPAASDVAATSEVLAIASLARAVTGEAGIADVGALTWMMLRHVMPAVSMSIYIYDERRDALTAEFAAGAHAAALRGSAMTIGSGVAGWAAANRRFVLNADPAIDVGLQFASAAPPLRSSLTMPLLHEGALTGVVSLYASSSDAFSDDHARLLTLLTPSLATSLAALPKTAAWTGTERESLRPAAGELRLLKRR